MYSAWLDVALFAAIWLDPKSTPSSGCGGALFDEWIPPLGGAKDHSRPPVARSQRPPVHPRTSPVIVLSVVVRESISPS